MFESFHVVELNVIQIRAFARVIFESLDCELAEENKLSHDSCSTEIQNLCSSPLRNAATEKFKEGEVFLALVLIEIRVECLVRKTAFTAQTLQFLNFLSVGLTLIKAVPDDLCPEFVFRKR